MMPFTVPKIVNHPLLWRFVGFGSSIVGFSCYALSPSFHDLFGKFNPLKIVIYCVVSLFLSCLMLSANKCWLFARSFLVRGCLAFLVRARMGFLVRARVGFLIRAHVGFLVLTLTSLYSFCEDRTSEEENEEKRYGRVLNLCSSGAFALMSLSLSRQLEFRFEMGMFNFFLGCFLVTLMKMNFKIFPAAAFVCYVLINIRSYSDYLREKHRAGGGETGETEHPDLESGPHNDASDSDEELETPWGEFEEELTDHYGYGNYDE